MGPTTLFQIHMFRAKTLAIMQRETQHADLERLSTLQHRHVPVCRRPCLVHKACTGSVQRGSRRHLADLEPMSASSLGFANALASPVWMRALRNRRGPANMFMVMAQVCIYMVDIKLGLVCMHVAALHDS